METAYHETEALLRVQIREAELDHEAFSRPMKVCRLMECRATCCHDGVFLSDGEMRTIQRVLDERTGQDQGVEQWFEMRNGRVKTAVKKLPERMLPAGYPAHFPKSRCVFLDQHHKCELQKWSMAEDRMPWYWKPVSCWMHPLLLKSSTRGGRPRLTLAEQGNDPTKQPDYPGFSSFTPCGERVEGGVPAWEALRGELALLGRIGGRDLVAELSASRTDPDE